MWGLRHSVQGRELVEHGPLGAGGERGGGAGGARVGVGEGGEV